MATDRIFGYYIHVSLRVTAMQVMPWPGRFKAFRRELRGIFLALLLVGATTIIAYAMIHAFGLRRGSFLYLVPVLLAGWHLGLLPALVAAAASVLWSGYFFYSSSYSYYIARPGEIINLVLFMVVGVVTSHLATSMKRQHEIARRREDEMGNLYAFSRRLTGASSAADIRCAIEEHLASLVQRDVLLFDGSHDPASDPAAAPPAVREAITDVQRGLAPSRTITDGNGNIWVVRLVSEKTPDFGVIAIDLGSVESLAAAEIQRRIDEVLSDAAATLERLDVARTLNEAKMRSETELLREALIGSVSHELRTPLASILGAATILRKSPVLAQDERLSSLVNVVRDEAERLNNDIQNLLDATRISRQQVKPRLEWIELADIVNSALRRRQRRLADHHVTLEIDSGLPFIYVDPAMVEQAFSQVIDNAAKYSPIGSSINVAAGRNGSGLVLSVTDRGAGLTGEEKVQIGQRFFRGPRLAATASGSGLGLWIANAFITANGGKVHAMSEGANRGTTVAIHFPLATNAEQSEVVRDD